MTEQTMINAQTNTARRLAAVEPTRTPYDDLREDSARPAAFNLFFIEPKTLAEVRQAHAA